MRCYFSLNNHPSGWKDDLNSEYYLKLIIQFRKSRFPVHADVFPVSGRTSQPLIEWIHGSSCLVLEIGICTYHNRTTPGLHSEFYWFQRFGRIPAHRTRTVPSNGFPAQSSSCHISRHHIFQRNPASIQSFGLSLTRIAKHSSASILLITTILQSESNLRYHLPPGYLQN